MASVQMINERTREVRQIKVGFSWPIFCFSWVFGIPLFRRGLRGLGVFMIFWTIGTLILLAILPPIAGLLLPIYLGSLGYFGRMGNEYTAKKLLARGWSFLEPESNDVRYACLQWKIAI